MTSSNLTTPIHRPMHGPDSLSSTPSIPSHRHNTYFDYTTLLLSFNQFKQSAANFFTSGLSIRNTFFYFYPPFALFHFNNVFHLCCLIHCCMYKTINSHLYIVTNSISFNIISFQFLIPFVQIFFIDSFISFNSIS